MSIVSRHRYCRLQSGTAKTLTALPWGMRGCVFRGRNFSRKVPPPSPHLKSFHTFFLVLWNVHPLKAQVLPIAVRHRQDPDCAPVGARGCVFRGRNFSRKVPPPAPPLQKLLSSFFLCDGSVHRIKAQEKMYESFEGCRGTRMLGACAELRIATERCVFFKKFPDKNRTLQKPYPPKIASSTGARFGWRYQNAYGSTCALRGWTSHDTGKNV